MAKRKIDFTLRDYWNQDSLLVYKEAVSRYPYCAPARLSFLLNLKALDDPDYERELAFTALAVPDRQRLQEEVRAAEQAAAVLRERGERRLRQAAARWAVASATAAVVRGRLMNAEAASAGDEGTGSVTVSAGMLGREVDFRAVAANEPTLLREMPSSAGAGADGQSGLSVAGVADEAGVAADVGMTEAEYPSARSRSSRRNARRLARREAQKAAEREAAAAMRTKEAACVAETAYDFENTEAEAGQEPAAASLTISMLWAEEPASVPHAAAVSHAAVAPRETVRRRAEVFNPWAEVFTAKHTISDWLQDEAEDDTAAEAVENVSAPSASPASSVGRSAKTAKSVKTGTTAKTAKPAAKKKPQAAASRPQPGTVPGYIDPNELIDRFLRKNDDHILIQVDEERDYSAFDPDRGSLREDWSMGSETLAQLYLKQGAPDKAIEIYRYLSLKFPEKNRYFAGLIRAAEDAKGGK